jgi:hypothetical protein
LQIQVKIAVDVEEELLDRLRQRGCRHDDLRGLDDARIGLGGGEGVALLCRLLGEHPRRPIARHGSQQFPAR